jgi:hypothetical protein
MGRPERVLATRPVSVQTGPGVAAPSVLGGLPGAEAVGGLGVDADGAGGVLGLGGDPFVAAVHLGVDDEREGVEVQGVPLEGSGLGRAPTEQAAARHQPVSIVSNNGTDPICQWINRVGLQAMIASVYGRAVESLDKMKPNPSPLKAACNRLQIDPASPGKNHPPPTRAELSTVSDENQRAASDNRALMPECHKTHSQSSKSQVSTLQRDPRSP